MVPVKWREALKVDNIYVCFYVAINKTHCILLPFSDMTSQAAKRPRTEMNGEFSNALGNMQDYSDVSFLPNLNLYNNNIVCHPELKLIKRNQSRGAMKKVLQKLEKAKGKGAKNKKTHFSRYRRIFGIIISERKKHCLCFDYSLF